MIKELAAKYNVSPTQVILGWGLARGVCLATQSKNEAHRKETLNVGLDESGGSKRRPYANDVFF